MLEANGCERQAEPGDRAAGAVASTTQTVGLAAVAAVIAQWGELVAVAAGGCG
jgi:hypothetical protein